MAGHRLYLSIALVAIVLAVYDPVRNHEFVTFDDYDFIVDNAQVTAGLTAGSVPWSFAHAYDAAGGPLTWLSHMLDAELFGMAPGPHHLQSVLLHAVNTVLLLLVLSQMTGSVWRSAFVAALFAVHPMHVESVAWVSERKDVLAATFWMLTMWAYISYVRQPGALRYGVVALALTLGLLAKPMVATLPVILLLLDVWPLNRAAAAWSGRAGWRALLLEKVPLLALAAAFLVWTLVAQRGIGAVVTLEALPFPARLANASMSLVTYIAKLVWPSGLAVFYPFARESSVWFPLASAGLLLGASLLVWHFAARRPHLIVGWLWYLVTLIPVIGLVQVGSHAMADRFTYLPAIGLFLIVAWEGAAVLSRIFRSPKVAVAVGLVVVLVLAVAARTQVDYWRTSETLWDRALAVTANNFRAHAGLAEVRSRQGRIDEAIAHYSEAVRLAPDEAEWHVNLGLLLVRQGEIARAAESFERAVRLRPRDAESYNNLGATLARLGRTPEAIAAYARALEIRPQYALARRNLGLALASHGDIPGGIAACLEALRLSPNEPAWHYEVAVMLLNQRRIEEARVHLNDTLRLDATHEGARQTLAALGR
ncbi:MAG TPA: tetratricopeptide repeat protein [Vicinamibacterales bacterium]|nr:tetratricopeptide repeat protein [Vicinamibacterales bacterium]